MKNYRLIEDLRIKVAAYQRPQGQLGKNRKDRTNQLIAKLLFEAEIYPYRLCRETVGKILAGDVLWPREDGQDSQRNHKSLNVSTLDELESAYLARFINGELRLVSVPNESEKYPKKNNKHIRTIRYLQDMIWGRNGFVPQHLRIEKDKAEPLLCQNDLRGADCEFLTSSEGYFSFKLDRSDCGPVGGKLWTIILNKSQGGGSAVSDWLRLIEWAFQDGYWGDIQFENEAEKLIFSDLGVETILSEPDLIHSWEDELYMQAMEDCRHNDALRWEDYKETVSIGLPDPCMEEDFTGLFLYTSRLKQNLSALEMRSNISALLNMIIENEVLYMGKDSFQRTQKLLDGSYKRPGLFQMLTLPYRVSNLTYYFLYHRDFVVIGMFQILVNSDGPTSYYGDKDYSLSWRKMLWSQCLDIFSNHIAGAETDAQLCLNLISKLAQDTYNPPRDGFYQGLHGKINLDLALQTLRDLKSSNSIISYISDRLTTSLDSTHSFGGNIPFGEYYLIFWCAGVLHNASSMNFEKKKIIGSIALSLHRSYLCILAEMIQGQGIGSSEDDEFFMLNWPLIFRNFSENQRSGFIAAIDTGDASSDLSSHSCIRAIRIHFRLLLKLYDERTIKKGGYAEEIGEQLKKLVVKYGFPKGTLLGIFNHVYEKGSNLWARFSILINLFDITNRSEFIDQLLELNIPLVSLMEFHHHSVFPEDKARLLNAINRRNIADDEINWVPEMEKAIQLSLTQKSYSLVESLIELGRKKANPVHRSLWKMLEFKYQLHRLFDNEKDLVEDRIQKITDFPIPEFPNKFEPDHRNTYHQKAERAKRFFKALLFLEEEPKKSYMWLNQLCNESSNQLYKLNRVLAKLKVLDKDEETSDEYLNLVNEWLEERKKTSHHEFSEFESLLLLTALSKGNDPVAFNMVWSRVPDIYKIKIDIVEASCESMKKYGLFKEALDLISVVKSHYRNSTEKVLRLEKIASNIGQSIALDKNIQPILLMKESGLTVAGAKKVWNEMRRFDQDVQAQIFYTGLERNNVLKAFLLENILAVCNELLLRGQNLRRTKAENERLQIENIINDWFVSLLRCQFDLIGWKVSEGDRSGRSETEKDIGVSDIRLFDSNGTPSLLCEAFLQESYSRSVIEKHIQKLAGYNSQGVEMIFVLVYSLRSDFHGLCNKYISVLNDLIYHGFDPVPRAKPIEEINYGPNAKTKIKAFTEIQNMNRNPISIYHVLIDFS